MSTRSKGKSRAVKRTIDTVRQEDTEDDAGGSHVAQITPKRSHQKKAITKQCPVCEEQIPIRLLDAHVELELSRVEEIVESVGKKEYDSLALDVPAAGRESEAGPSRKAAIRARRSLTSAPTLSSTSSSSRTTGNTTPRTAMDPTTDLQAAQAIKLAIRNRKQRFAKLRELGKDAANDDDVPRNGRACPICSIMIEGDNRAVETHVDECIALASQVEQAQRDHEDRLTQYEVNGETRVRVTDLAGFRGTGFDVRNTAHVDIDEDIDVDGGDETLYGEAQFTEMDIIVPMDETHVDIGGSDDDVNPLRELVSKPSSSRQPHNSQVRLESQPTESSGSQCPYTCRICLDGYTDPTVSTGCWHTCCRGCWLQCLGTTKLCPICKRITGVSELRRIYL